MRLALAFAVLCSLLALPLGAQDATASDPPVIVKTGALPAVILDKGPHQQTIQTTTLLTDASGVVTTNISSVVALGTGLNYFDPARKDWVASEPTFDLTANGVTAQRLQHSVALLGNPNQKGAVQLTLPDGQVMVSHVLALQYYDAASGNSIALATVQDSQGQLLPGGRQVIFTDVFKGLQADLRYTLSVGGLEQDVILNENPPAPETFGLVSDTTRMEVVTEFTTTPAPKITPTVLAAADDARRPTMAEPDFVDQFLDFGSMVMLPGRAFDIAGESVGLLTTNQFIPVGKQWQVIAGRAFLFEQVAYPAVLPLLKTLPDAKQARANATNLPTRMAAVSQTGRARLLTSPDPIKGRGGQRPSG